MDFVTVGNAGNAADDTGFGAVGYNYRIGKYEVTADQWAAVLAADSNVGNAGSWSGSQPTAGTTWYEAAKFCNWLTTGSANSGVYNTSTWAIMDHQTAVATFGTAYFIPTENEWYKAAHYDPNKSGAGVGGYWDYPTKHDSPNVPDGIDSAGDTAFDAVFHDGYNQGHPDSVDSAGVLSAYGTMGQGGNVWEWNETAIGFGRGLRGGDWDGDSDNLLASYRTFTDPSFLPPCEIDNIGFRVASVSEPASIGVFPFYNNSSWDDSDESANAADDGAIATDKVALLPGATATSTNYTSYDKGINGLMIDLYDLPDTPTLNDFLFRWGNDNKPYGDDLDDPADDWLWAPDPVAIAMRLGEGQDGADRVTLIWEDGAICNCWLQVTVLATDATGLAENAVFYVGNAVGESGDSTTDALVNATDEIGARNNPHSPFNPALIDDAYDFNRDALVNATDQITARNNRTSPFTALKLITPPLEGP